MSALSKALVCSIVTLSLLTHRGQVASAAKPLEGGVDPQRIEQISAMLGEQPLAFGPKIDDRAGWQRLAAVKPSSKAIREAEKDLASPLPEMTEELYMLFKKTGRRTAEYGRARSARYGRITRFTVAECLEDKGRSIPPLETAPRSICEEKTLDGLPAKSVPSPQ
jgi:hypothetical protein